jgi:hypothetical protein
VELGQVAALGAMVAVLAAWRHTPSFARYARATNVALLLVGALLLLYQLHGYLHTAGVEEFPINRDDHAHLHQEADL